MKKDNNAFDDEDRLGSLVSRFENMIKDDQNFFFDAEDFEEIIDYYISRSDKKKTEYAITAALNQHPNHSVFLLKKAQHLISVDKTTEALQLLGDLEKIDPYNTEVYMIKGAVYSQLNKFEKAIEAYKQSLIDDSNSSEVYTNIAFEYENLGKYEQAINYLKLALERDVDDYGLLYELSFCYEIIGKQESGLNFFLDFLNEYPYSKEGWYNLGMLYSSLELYEKAIQSYEYALAIDEHFLSVILSKAHSLSSLGEHQQAIHTYKEALKLDKHDASTYYLVGENYANLEEYPKAIEYYKKCLKLDDKHSDAWIGIGIAKNELNKPEAATKYIRKAVQLEPYNSDFWSMLAFTESRAGNTERAINSYEKTLQIDESQPSIWIEYADLLAENEQIREASEAMKRAETLHPDDEAIKYRRSAYLMLLGKKKEAMAVLEKALKINPGNYDYFLNYDDSLRISEDALNLIEAYIEKQNKY